MNSDIWLPLVTLVGGWGLAQVSETLRDRRTTDRERLARRAELQRTTLLSLQDQLLEVLKLSAIWDAWTLTNERGSGTPLPKADSLPPEWNMRMRAKRPTTPRTRHPECAAGPQPRPPWPPASS